MAVLNPVKLVIENYPEGKVEYLEARTTEGRSWGPGKYPFQGLYIEQEDFAKYRRPNSSGFPRKKSG